MKHPNGLAFSWVRAAVLSLCLALLAVSAARAQVMAFLPDDALAPVAGQGSFLGVGVVEIAHASSQALKLKEDRGVEITRVEQNSPAQKAGLQVGDVVLSFGGQSVIGIEQFARLVRETPAGREVTIEISRDGRISSLPVTIGTLRARAVAPLPLQGMQMVRPEFFGFIGAPDVPRAFMSWGNPTIGVECEGIDGQFAEFFGVKEGVLVRSVRDSSPAAKAGIKAGDVITRVEGKAISAPREITAVLREKKPGTAMTVQLVRNRKDMTVNIPVEDPASQREPRIPARSVKN